MAEGRLVMPRALRRRRDGERAVAMRGRGLAPYRRAVRSALLSAWRREMDDVRQRLVALRGDVPDFGTAVKDQLPVGVHALLTLAGARLGRCGGRRARRRRGRRRAGASCGAATRGRSRSTAAGFPVDARANEQGHVLRGDWSITQAARLAAEHRTPGVSGAGARLGERATDPAAHRRRHGPRRALRHGDFVRRFSGWRAARDVACDARTALRVSPSARLGRPALIPGRPGHPSVTRRPLAGRGWWERVRKIRATGVIVRSRIGNGALENP